MLRVTVVVAICCFAAALAQAQEPSGHTVAVVPDASAFNTAGVRLLSAQEAVFMGDRLKTGSKGEAQIEFLDGTRLVVGPSASLLIDSFVVEDKTVRRFAINALQGAFRFFSGNGPKSAYVITTPTVTMGIRGTEFDFTVLPDGETEFVLIHGEVEICDKFGNCIVAGRPCTLVSAPVKGPIRLLPTFQRSQRLEDNFPYVVSQGARLEKAFQTDVSRCSVYAQGAGSAISIALDDTPRPLASSAGSAAGGGGADLPALNVLFTPDGGVLGGNARGRSRQTGVGSLSPQIPLAAFVGGTSTPFEPDTAEPPSSVLPPEPGPSVAVPGPVSGAGLPMLVAALGFVWWRRRRASAAYA